MAKLYELTEGYRNIMELIESGEMEKESLAAAISTIENDMGEKLDNITCIIREYERDIEAIKKEEERLKARKVTLGNAIEGLKHYIKVSLQETGKKSLKTSLNSWTIRKATPSVNILDNMQIPKELTKEKITIEVDKKAIKEKILNGEQVAGAELIYKESLLIK
ncbi:MAG: siphovirus Gp157 family protein [Clostridium sp.]|uniref:siphovirus Gp157 family protein n=1 Tax=Clostridium sp. TaxID=1506 RepID=UPI003EE6F922